MNIYEDSGILIADDITRFDMSAGLEICERFEEIEKDRDIPMRIVDLTAVQTLELDFRAVNSLSDRRRPCAPAGKTAFIYGNEVMHGFCNMWRLLMADVERLSIRGFDTRERSVAWLQETDS